MREGVRKMNNSGGSPWRRCESCVSAGPSSY